MKVLTKDLIGPALDWAVASSDGRPRNVRTFQAGYFDYSMYHYSTDWAQGGPIIEREGITTSKTAHGFWEAYKRPASLQESYQTDNKPLIAAMRCYVASKLGEEVDVPEELCGGIHGL